MFNEIVDDEQIELKTEFGQSFEVRLHPFLADSLISNLLGNAIKYNYSGGEIIIVVKDGQYCISNTSLQPAIDPRQLFKRFTSASNKKQTSTGLGLAIVKRIADTHGLPVLYDFEAGVHRFCLHRYR